MQNKPNLPLIKSLSQIPAQNSNPDILQMQARTVRVNSANDNTIQYYNKLKEKELIPKDLEYTKFHDLLGDDLYLDFLYKYDIADNPDAPSFSEFANILRGEDLSKKEKKDYTINNHLEEFQKATEAQNNRLTEALPSLFEIANSELDKRKQSIIDRRDAEYRGEHDQITKSGFFMPEQQERYLRKAKEKATNGLYEDVEAETKKVYNKLDETIYKEYIGSSYFDRDDKTSGILKKGIERISGDEFKNSDFEKKQYMIEEAWADVAKSLMRDYMAFPELNDKPLDLEKARQEFIFKIGNVALRNDEGDFSNYAVKNVLKNSAEQIEQRLSEPEMKAASKFETELANASGSGLTMIPKMIDPSTVVPYEDLQEYRALAQARDLVKHGLAIPENDLPMMKEALKGFSNHEATEYIPFLHSIYSIPNASRIKKVSDKINKGLELNSTEKLLATASNFSNLALSTSDNSSPTSAYRVFSGVAEMLPYMGEFAFSMGIATGTAKGVATVLNFTAKKGFNKVMQKAITYGIGALAQSTANPQNYIEETLTRMTPQAVSMFSQEGDDILTLIDSQGQGFGEAFAKAYGLNYLEFLTEMMGPANMGAISKVGQWGAKGVGKMGNYVGVKLPEEFMMRAILAKYMAKKGFFTPKQLSDHFLKEKIGWHGLLEEYSEEFVNNRLADLVTGENPNVSGGFFERRFKALSPTNYDWEQEAGTFLTVTAMQVPRSAFTMIPGVTQGNRMKFTKTEEDGSKNTIWLNTDQVRIATDFAKDPTQENTAKFNEVLKEKNLTSDQVDAIMYVTNKQAKETMAEEALASKKKIDLEEAEKADKKESKKVDKPERTIDEKKQKAIIEAFPELEEEGVELTDKRPTKKSIKAHIDEIQKEIDENARFDEQGNQMSHFELTIARDKLQDVYDTYNDRLEKLNNNPDYKPKAPEPKGRKTIISNFKNKKEESEEEVPEVVEKEPEIVEKKPQGRNKRISDFKSKKVEDEPTALDKESEHLKKEFENLDATDRNDDLSIKSNLVINEQQGVIKEFKTAIEKSTPETIAEDLGKANISPTAVSQITGLDLAKIKTKEDIEILKKVLDQEADKIASEIETRSKIEPKEGQIVVGSNVFDSIDKFKEFVAAHPDPSAIDLMDSYDPVTARIISEELQARQEAKSEKLRQEAKENKEKQEKGQDKPNENDNLDKEYTNEEKIVFHNDLVDKINEYNKSSQTKEDKGKELLKEIKRLSDILGHTVIAKNGLVVAKNKKGKTISKYNPIKKKYVGKIVYMSPFSGVDQAAQNRENIISGNDVLREVLVEEGYGNDPDIKDSPGLVAFKHKDGNPNIQKKFKAKLKSLAKKGFTVLTENQDARDIADIVVLKDSSKEIFESSDGGLKENKAKDIFNNDRNFFVGKTHEVFAPNTTAEEHVTFETDHVKPLSEQKDPLKDPIKNIAEEIKDATKNESKKSFIDKANDFLENMKVDLKDNDLISKVIQDEEKRKKSILDIINVIGAPAWNGSLIVLQETLKAGQSISVAIANAAQNLLNSDWYKNSDKNKAKFIVDSFAKNMKLVINALSDNRMNSINDEILALDKSYLNNESNKMHSMTWGKIWKAIARELGVSRDQVEKEMLKLAINYDFSSVRNVQDYNNYVEILKLQAKDNNSIEGKVFSELSNLLDNITLDQAVSLFNYYNSINLISEYGIIFNSKGNSITMLNGSNKIGDYFSTFKRGWRNYSYKDKKGFPAIEQRIKDYTTRRYLDLGKFIRVGNVVTRTNYEKLNPKQRVEMKKKFFEEDLQLLEDLTGLPKETWRKYFSKQTKETFAPATSKSSNETEYANYDQLLENETYRYEPSTKTYFKRFESTLIFNLQDKFRKNQSSQKLFEDFFLKGDENKSVLSNLYKLSTVRDNTLSEKLSQVDRIALSGKSFNGDRFSSMQLKSDLLNRIEALIEQDNELGRFYKENGITPEMIMLNGIANRDHKKRHVGALYMSNEDIMLSDILMFLSAEEETYNHNLGQYGDKSKIAYLNVKKYDKIDQKWIDDNFPDFNDELKSMVDAVTGKLKVYLKSYFDKLGHKDVNAVSAKKVLSLYLYNYLKNQSDLFESINGDFKDYKEDYTAVVKRAGSMYSPGTAINENIDGGIGKSFTHAVAVDYENMHTDEVHNGITYTTGETAQRMAVSEGSVYNKLDKYFISTSIKALVDYVKNGHRTLIKTNWINIDTLVETFGEDSDFGKIKKFLLDNDLQSLSFTSGAKLSGEKPSFRLFDKDGNVLNEYNKDSHQFKIDTKNFLVQQDLRHDTEAKVANQTSQLKSNIIGLQHGLEAIRAMSDIQEKRIKEYVDEFFEAPEKSRIKWIKEHIDKDSQEHLLKMLNNGIGIEEPAVRNLFRTMLAASLTNDALNIPINRTTTQEIPAMESELKGLRPVEWKGKTRMLLPEIATGMAGIRYPEKFKSHKEAVEHINKNKGRYADMFTLNGELQEWAIEDGVIPGEYVLSTRVPSDDMHSHTLARATKYIPFANFTMLDIVSQLASGSDFDGDQRFNQVMIRNKYGQAQVNKNSLIGLSNYVIKLIAEDYTNPTNFLSITNPINTKRFDPIIKEINTNEKSLLDRKNGHLYPSAYFDAREKNMVGVKMKGIMTDITTVFSFLSSTDVGFKKTSIVKLGSKNYYLKGIVKDRFGVIKSMIGDLLNMAYDNAKEPKIEYLGLNEITAKLFSYMLMSNQDLDKIDNIQDYDKAAMDYIKEIALYFNTDLVQEFIKVERTRNGANRRGSIDQTKKYLLNKYADKQSEINNLFDLYNKSNDLFSMRQYLALTDNAPKNSAEYYEAKLLQKRINDNKLSLLDTSGISGNFEFIYKNVANSLSAAYNSVFSNSFEYSTPGDQIINAAMHYYAINIDNKRKKNSSINAFKRDVVPQFIRLLNRVAIIKSINKTEGISSISDRVVKDYEKLKEKYPDNMFFDYLDVKVENDGKNVLAINDNFLFNSLKEKDLDDVKEAFDSLPIDVKMDLLKYAIYQYGASETNSNGNYYSLLSDDIRKIASEMVSKELESWNTEQLEDDKKAEIFSIIASNLKYDEDTNQGSIEYDTDIYFEQDAQDNPEFVEGDQIKLDSETLKRKEKLKAHTIFFNRYKDRTTDGTVRNMMSSNNVSEALASEDPEIQSFITETLAKAYPGVKFFTDRDAFVEHVQNNHDRGYQSDAIYIGHAISDAVFVDPKTSRQTTSLHEYSHVYWDALPDSSKVKKAIRSLFKEAFPELNESELEERIIETIAKAGYENAELRLRGSLLDRFKALLKQFWGEVKALFGNVDKEFLADKIAREVWTNRRKINASTYEGRQVVKNMMESNLGKVIFDNTDGAHIYRNGSRIYPSSTQSLKILSEFDSEEASSKSAKGEKSTFEYSKPNISLTKEEMAELQDNIKDEWVKTSVTGTSIHAVNEEVFSDGKRPITPEEKGWLFNQAYNNLVEALTELKGEILEKHPNAKFLTEEIISSERFGIAGMVDLIVDIGDNKLIVYDIKTMNYDPNESEEYEKPFGYYSAPLQNTKNNTKNKHSLQTNIYANILEEAGNKVVEMYIIPIVRTTSPDGKIRNAEVKKPIPVNRTKETISMAAKVMIATNKSNTRSQLKQEIYYKKLVTNGYDTIIAKKMANVYFEYLNSNIIIETASYSDLERMRGTGISKIVSELTGLDYTDKDINKMSFEEMFYASQIGIKKDDLDKHFAVQNTRSKVRRKRKPYKGKAKVYFKGVIDGVTYYARQAKNTEIKPGDSIIEVYNLREKGKNITVKRVQQVEEVTKYGIVVKGDSGSSYIPSISKEKSYLLVENKADIDQKYLDQYSNDFEELYINEIVYDKQNHFNKMSLSEFKSRSDDKLGDKDYYRYERQVKLVWDFFTRYNTVEKMNALLLNQDQLTEEYTKLRIAENETTKSLVNFLKNAYVNHILAEYIQKESKSISRGEPVPIMYMAYQLFNKTEEANWTEYSNFTPGIANMLPARFQSERRVPIQFITSIVEGRFGKIVWDEIQFDNEYNAIRNKIKKANDNDFNIERIISTYKNKKFYKSSETKGLTSLEKEYLTMIENNYHKYDLRTRVDSKKVGYKHKIPVASVFLEKNEMSERFGKIGVKLYNKLKPSPFDGTMVKLKDSDNEVTLREIKAQFITEVLTPKDKDQLSEWLGTSSLNFINNVTSLVGINTQGKLDYYISQAKKTYYSKSGQEGGVIRKTQSIFSKKDSQSFPETRTENYVDAEQVVIKSIIKKHHTLDILPLMDMMRTELKEDAGMMNWLDKWVNLVVFNQTPATTGDAFTKSNEKVKDVISFVMRLNSLNKISFSVRTQIANFAIGQIMDIIREPEAWKIGFGRMLTDWNKSMDIAKRYGLANILDEDYFNYEKDKIKKVSDIGYWLMEKAEKLNQIPIFVGLMTEQEWNSFNKDASSKDVNNELSENRIQVIKDIVQSIHGDYSVLNAAPGWRTSLVRPILQFMKFMPGVVEKEIGGYKRKRSYHIESGIWPTVFLGGRIIINNIKGKEARLSRAKELLKFSDSTDVTNMNEYLAFIINQVEGEKIKLSDLSKGDRQNLRSATYHLALGAIFTILKMLYPDDPEEVKIVLAWRKVLNEWVLKLKGDLFFYVDQDEIKFKAQNAIPSADLFLSSLKVIKSIYEWETYDQDTPYAYQGQLKAPVMLTRVAPFGSALRQLMAAGMGAYRNHHIVKVGDLELTEKQIKLSSAKYDYFNRATKSLDIPVEIKRNMFLEEAYFRDISKEEQDFAKAYYYENMIQTMDQETADMLKNAKKLRKEDVEIKKEIKGMTRSKLKKQYQKALEEAQK